MTYPQQYPPQAYGQPPAAPQYPPQPQYAPPQPQYPPQAYAAPQQYPPQGYAPQYAAPAAPPAPPLPTGSLDDFFDQRSTGGGPSWKYMDASRQPLIGKTYAGFVARPVTSSDIQAQTDNNGKPQTFKDGRQKWVMIVPMLMQPTAEFPDGVAGWWVKGQARDELARAMSEAGAPAGPPEAGAFIQCTLVRTRPIPNFNPQFIYAIRYQRPQGAAPVIQSAPATPAVAPMGGPVEQYNNPSAPYIDPAYQTPQQVQFAPQAPMPQGVQVQPVQQFAPAQVSPQPAMAAPVAPAAPVAVPQAPQGMDAGQQALWAQLTGGQPIPQPQPQG